MRQLQPTAPPLANHRARAWRAREGSAGASLAREAIGVGPEKDEEAVRAKALERLRSDGNIIEEVWDEGSGLDLESALEFATAPELRALQAKEVG